MDDGTFVLRARGIRKSFQRDTGAVVRALDDVSLDAARGTLTALVGPDGAGKTTMIRLAAGLMSADEGTLHVLDVDIAAHPQRVQDRIGYMPQKFGLYEDLTVQENLDLYADLHSVPIAERRERYPILMEMTALGPFTSRLAGRLSGGMKQKLGLACTLVRSPDLLLLDEPTVGVDPLSRRELWEIILNLVHRQGLSVLLSTSYLDEAERCGHVVVLHEGKVLAQGRPADIAGLGVGRTFLVEPPAGQKASRVQARLLNHRGVVDAVPEGGRVRLVTQRIKDKGGRMREYDSSAVCPLSVLLSPWPGLVMDGIARPVAPRFEDGFMILLRRTAAQTSADRLLVFERSLEPSEAAAVVQVRDLVRRFDSFTAVDRISFEVQRGEIFGLLGPNGAGKTTTFRMLCGLLPATSGTLRVAGVDLRHARASARQRIGYVAQKFSLYGQLSVSENLEFFASAYGLRGEQKRDRLSWALREFELTPFSALPSARLPGGFKQRLAMAAALLHNPETLFLDEPTSGADPLARREFWQRITALSEQGVTVIITTHFMEEAEYCDKIAIMDAGRVLAQGTPAEIRVRDRSKPEPTMEDAFIAIVEAARETESMQSTAVGASR